MAAEGAEREGRSTVGGVETAEGFGGRDAGSGVRARSLVRLYKSNVRSLVQGEFGLVSEYADGVNGAGCCELITALDRGTLEPCV